MKKILFLMAAAGVMLTGCNKEKETPANNEEFTVSFNIKTPVSGSTIYSKATIAAIGNESKINDLYVYVFGPTVETPTSTDDYILEGIQAVTGTIVAEADQQTVTIGVRGRNKKHFWFVANRQFTDITAANYGTTDETTVLNALLGVMSGTSNIALDGSTSVGGRPGMQMSAFKEIDFTGGAPSAAVSIPMVRSVARLDIVNTASATFVIENVIIHSRANGYLFPTVAGSNGKQVWASCNVLPAYYERVDAGLPAGGTIDYGTITIPGATDQSQRMNAVGYLYEANATDNAYLVVNGKYNGQNKSIQVPFKASATAIAVNRNHVYTFTIKDELSGLAGTFEVAEWEDGGSISFITDASYAIDYVSRTINSGGTASVASNGGTFTTVNTGGNYTLKYNAHGLTLKTLNTAILPSWVTGATLVYNSTDKVYELTFTVQANATGAQRSCSLYLIGDVPSQPGRAIRIVQNA